MMRGIVPLNERSGTTGAPTRRGLLDGNRIGRRKGVLEGFVERLFLAPTLIAIAIVLMRFAFGSAIISVSLTALMKIFRDMTQISVRCSTSCIPFASSGCRTTYSWRHVHRQFSHHWTGLEANAPAERRSFHHSDAVLHRPLHLLEGAHLDLAHAFARHAELGRQILERDRVVGKPPRLEDAPLALVEHRERFTERLLAVLRFLVLDEPRLLIGDFVDEPVLPFAGIAVVADRGVGRPLPARRFCSWPCAG